jgi:group I intron endonuclease
MEAFMLFDYQGNSLKSGVYKLTNLSNNRIYIGSAKGFKQRWYQHHYALKNNKHSNGFLQADYNKCGTEAFVFEVLEVTSGDRQERLLLEEKYISQFYDKGQSCYNLCRKAVSREGCRSKNPEETKRKMSFSMKEAWKRMTEGTKQKRSELIRAAQTSPASKERIKKKWENEEYRQKMKQFSKQNGGWNRGLKFPEQSGVNHPMYGKKHTEETINKIKETILHSGRKPWNKDITGYTMPPCSDEKKEKLRIAHTGKTLSDETKKRISENRKGKNAGKNSSGSKIYEGFILLAPDGTTYNRIECLTEFAKEHGLNMKCLWKLLKGKTPSTRGWRLLK